MEDEVKKLREDLETLKSILYMVVEDNHISREHILRRLTNEEG